VKCGDGEFEGLIGGEYINVSTDSTPLTLLTLLTPNWDLYANEYISHHAEETSRPWELELPTWVDFPG
jgi:hypothetical protein